MTGSIDRLAERAERVLATVPAGVLSGDVPAALQGMGFLGRWAVTALPAAGIRLACGYDGNPALAGTMVEGLPVRHAESLAEDRPALVFVTARHAVRPVMARLEALGLAGLSADAFFVARDFARFRAIHAGLDDDRSRQVLEAVLEAMLTGDRAPLTTVFEKDQYFALPAFCGIEKEIYVDAGAYVGDSLERFVWTHYGVFEKAIAFEPGARQFASLKLRTERLVAEWALEAGQIELVPAALGNRAGAERAASQSGQMTSLALGSGTDEIRVARLDDHLAGRRISFLKADVEGMEVPLIDGAADTIRKHRPKLAICVYHYPTDIPVILHQLQSLVPDYRFALRHHSPQLMETVLYAWTG
jgi:FkbM family methyltransferase